MARKHFIRGRAVRRKMLWLFLDQNTTQLTGVSSALIASLNAAALALRPFTIVRTHITFFQESDQAAAIEQQFSAFGMTIVSDQAVAAGVASIPTPGTDQASDWFIHSWQMTEAQTLTDRTTPSVQFQIDSKAMRKVDSGQDLAIMMENVVAAGVRLTAAGRILVKLH